VPWSLRQLMVAPKSWQEGDGPAPYLCPRGACCGDHLRHPPVLKPRKGGRAPPHDQDMWCGFHRSFHDPPGRGRGSMGIAGHHIVVLVTVIIIGQPAVDAVWESSRSGCDHGCDRGDDGSKWSYPWSSCSWPSCSWFVTVAILAVIVPLWPYSSRSFWSRGWPSL
jgi:hypothetical protein